MNAAARKIQAVFRRKRVFSENSGLGFKLSKPTIISTVTTIEIPVNFINVFSKIPIGFTEVAGYIHFRAKPRVRYVKGQGWLGGGEDQVKYITAKHGKTTVILKKNQVQVNGSGNFEEIYLMCIKNGWIPKTAIRMKPKYKIINCKFRVNKTIDLPVFLNYIKHKIPKEMISEPPKSIISELRTPALTVKFNKPKVTYQFFRNGTILFSGITKIENIDVPPELFKQFFTKYEFDAEDVFGAAGKTAAANPNPLAGSWNKLPTRVPQGYYIRPGTDGLPRLYPYQYYRKLHGGPNILNSAVNLGPIAPKVRKAFKEAGKPIPQSTLNVFRNAGYPLNTPSVNTTTYSGPANRRAPSWNATHAGFYVRPGAGGQPYWYSIPKGKAAGRKTVIAAYTKAGRNIPSAVREIFKIPSNFKINNSKKKHEFMQGVNGILRINGKQATRLTKTELLAIARNEKIAEVNNKMKPANIIAYLATRSAPAGKYNATIGNMKYKFLANARVRRLKTGSHPTTRNWATIKPAEKNSIIKTYIKKEDIPAFLKYSVANQYGIIYQKAQNGSPSLSGSSITSLNLENVYKNNEYVKNENFG